MQESPPRLHSRRRSGNALTQNLTISPLSSDYKPWNEKSIKNRNNNFQYNFNNSNSKKLNKKNLKFSSSPNLSQMNQEISNINFLNINQDSELNFLNNPDSELNFLNNPDCDLNFILKNQKNKSFSTLSKISNVSNVSDDSILLARARSQIMSTDDFTYSLSPGSSFDRLSSFPDSKSNKIKYKKIQKLEKDSLIFIDTENNNNENLNLDTNYNADGDSDNKKLKINTSNDQLVFMDSYEATVVSDSWIKLQNNEENFNFENNSIYSSNTIKRVGSSQTIISEKSINSLNTTNNTIYTESDLTIIDEIEDEKEIEIEIENNYISLGFGEWVEKAYGYLFKKNISNFKNEKKIKNKYSIAFPNDMKNLKNFKSNDIPLENEYDFFFDLLYFFY